MLTVAGCVVFPSPVVPLEADGDIDGNEAGDGGPDNEDGGDGFDAGDTADAPDSLACECPLVCSEPCAPVTALVAGETYTCAIAGDHTVCWGRSREGGPHIGSFEIGAPGRVGGLNRLPPLVQLAGGRRHACGLDADGAPWCWGLNNYSQAFVHNNQQAATYAPQTPFLGLALGAHTSCALGDGLYCWGVQTDGSGVDVDGPYNPELSTESKPTKIALVTPVVDVLAIGASHTCFAIKGDPVAICWGNNDFGQLGYEAESTTDLRAILPFGAGVGVQGLQANDNVSCALSDSGAVACWGQNVSGALGANPAVVSMRIVPTLIAGLSGVVTSLSVGGGHVCAITNDTLFCWGDNTYGQLGREGPDSQWIPTAVPLLSAVRHVAAGQRHTCAVTDDAVFCWGDDSDGQLGTGTFGSPTAIPRRVEPWVGEVQR